MAKPIRLIVEPVGDREIRAFRFSIPEIPGASVELNEDQLVLLAEQADDLAEALARERRRAEFWKDEFLKLLEQTP